MPKRSRLVVLLASAALLMALGGSAYAYDVPDLLQVGSVEVTMRLDDAPVGGGAVALYRVGFVQEDDGDFSFVLSDGFEGSGVPLSNIQSADVASLLASYAADHDLGPLQVKRIGANGHIAFDNLPCGLYLLIQTRAATGYELANPFLAAVPTMVDGAYYYEVDASPKVELAKKPEEPREPNIPQTADAVGAVAGEAGLGALAGVGLMAGGLLLGRKGMRRRA